MNDVVITSANLQEHRPVAEKGIFSFVHLLYPQKSKQSKNRSISTTAND
jgi:hypothetical protein